MEDQTAYSTSPVSEPIAALLRANGFTTSRVLEAEQEQAVIGSWQTRDGQAFQAYYHRHTHTGQQTFELKARRGEYQAQMGRMLVRTPQDVQFLLDAWHVLAEARRTTSEKPPTAQ